jgi:hypothetical protein
MCQRGWEPPWEGRRAERATVTQAWPNKALHLTAASVRSFLASDSGSR